MNTARKASLLSIGIGLLILVVTSPALGRYAFAQDKTQAGDSNSGAGVSKKDLKQLSSCQSKAAKDGDLTQTELDSCYNDSFPGSQSTSNTTPQSTSNTTPQSTSNTTPQSTSNNTPESQPNQIGDMNSSIGKDLPIDKATIQEIIKNRFG